MVECKMAEFKMATIIKLSQNEWVKYFVQMLKREEGVNFFFFFGNGGNQSWPVWVSLRWKTKIAEFEMAKLKMAAIIKMSQNEWVKFFLCKCTESMLASVSEFERKN